MSNRTDQPKDDGLIHSASGNTMTQPQEKKEFREFWIDPSEDELSPDDIHFGEALMRHPRQGPLLWQSNLIHVIEHAALVASQNECKELKQKIEGLYVEIEHGDAEHRAWLKDKIDNYFNIGAES